MKENLNLDIKECQKYKNILLIPGFGHIDINVTKALFKLMWKVCIKDLAVILGWKSLKALTACENCTDHHKATQILQILFESLKMELLKPFVAECEEKHEHPTIEQLYEYVGKQSKNYIFHFKCTFTYLFAWKMLKKGMRRANYNYIKMSMDKLSTLFYGLNMTTYMDLWFRFDNTVLQAPPEVQDFIKKNICMSQSGHPSKAEGGDFILERTNKKIKSYMPHGVPTDERWTRVCRSIDNIEEIKRAFISKDQHTDGDDRTTNKYFRKFSAPDAVEDYSNKIRMYLTGGGQHTSTDDKPLDHDLVNFDVKCEANKSKYYENFPDVLRICERIFITPDDRSNHFDITQKDKETIQKMIINVLKDIHDAGGIEESTVLTQQWSKDVKNGKKNILLTFYREVVQYLQDITNRNATLENEAEQEESD
ncbi:uncharacterized protein LOC123552823 [Mercenaria mercenaria]|uniref:uncharacterized protein LOC123552823 n=1 Tax=Mercenaria mercenaria TaxID=6596 RepID=UPI00234F04B6|nr:uncharacterized protein LOC123552823 [Mercenaria mercenaria]